MPCSRIDVDRDPAQDRVVDVGRADVGHDRAVEERVGAAAGPVDELVAHDEVAGLDVSWSEPAAHGEMTALTPSERIAQTFAR